jgi:hypothetical protein
LVARAYGWVIDTLRARGGNPSTGNRLHCILRDVGFGRIGMAIEIPSGDADSGLPHFVAGTVNSLLPAIVASGVATREEIGIETLAERIVAELRESDAVLWPPELVAVWARV